jgi:hypothetical protein
MPKKVMDQSTEEAPQFDCDKRREPEYSNNVHSKPKGRWLTGAVQATEYACYDQGPKWFFGPNGK